MTNSVEAGVDRTRNIPKLLRSVGSMGGVRFVEAVLFTAGIAFGNGSPVELSQLRASLRGVEVAVNLDGKPFGYPDECRVNAPCDPEQDPLAPSPTPSDQLPQGSQPA